MSEDTDDFEIESVEVEFFPHALSQEDVEALYKSIQMDEHLDDVRATWE